MGIFPLTLIIYSQTIYSECGRRRGAVSIWHWCKRNIGRLTQIKNVGREAWHTVFTINISKRRSSHPEVFLGKGVVKICSKFKGEHPCRSAISIRLQSDIIEITFRHECSPVNLLHIFRTPFLKNTSGWLLL